MHRLSFILSIQILIIVPAQCQLQVNYNINNMSAQVIGELQRNYEANDVPVDFVEVIRELQPDNIIKTYARKGFRQKIVNETECDIEFGIFLNGLMTFEQWALKMLDSSSKIPSGILIGNMKDLGVYDECISVEVTRNEKLIRGRHCMYSLSVKAPNTTISVRSTMSICLPAACNSEHVVQIVQNAINTTSGYHDFHLEIGSAECSAVDPEPWGIGDIIAISILTVFVGFLIICTICDIFLGINGCHTPLNTRNTILEELGKFSLYANAKRVLDTTVPPGNLPAIQGIRFFSMCWVILGHEYALLPMGAVINMAHVGEWISSWQALYILIAPFSVDTFFVLSGFLTSYLFMKEISRSRKFNIIMYYVHRYIRLTPALGALLLLTIYVLPRIGSGALWESNAGFQKRMCSKNWWSMLLYVHNFVNIDYMWCLIHTWYLAVDMQLFWISPLILYPMAKKPKLGFIILLVFLIASVITPAVIAAENRFSGALITALDLRKVIDTMTRFYITTYTRTGPWLLGIILGYILSRKRIPPSKKLIYFGWTFTVLTFAFSFFTYKAFQAPEYEWYAPWEVFYAAFARHIWAVGICWIIYASALGYGGILSQLLSLPVFIPFARISYSIYLVHFVIQTLKIGAMRTPEYFSDLRVIYLFFGDFVICTFGGFIFSLLFESPSMVIEKMFLSGKKMECKNLSKEVLNDAEASVSTDSGFCKNRAK